MHRLSNIPVFILCLAISLCLLLPASPASAEMWGPPWKGKPHKTSMSRPAADPPFLKQAAAGTASPEPERAAAPVPSVSSTPKPFWMDCGLDDYCSSPSLYYTDPGLANPAKTLLDSNIFLPLGDHDISELIIISGVVNTTTHQLSGLYTQSVYYIKNGQIWLADAVTGAKRRVSNQSGITPANLCEMGQRDNWQNPSEAMISYTLAGPDGQCWTVDDKRKAVRISMSATTVPIDLGFRYLEDGHFDGKVIVADWGVNPPVLKACPMESLPAWSACSPKFLDLPQNSWVWEEAFDANYALIMVGDMAWSNDSPAAVYRYKMATNSAIKLYDFQQNNQHLEALALDRDGYAYLITGTNSSPYVNYVKRIALESGSVQDLASFTTNGWIDEAFLQLTPNRVVFGHPVNQYAAMALKSMPKSGGTPLLLSDAMATGGIIGDYALIEDTGGKIILKDTVTGVTLKSKAGTLLSGVTIGGSWDWHYGLVPSTARYFLMTINNQIKSYAPGEDFTNPASGISMGTLPANLSNVEISGLDDNALGVAGRRHREFSFGRDILFYNSAAQGSQKRLTNTNGNKQTITVKD